VPVSDGRYEALLWLRGTYRTYADYDLDVVGIITPVPDPAGAALPALAALALMRRRRR
jgi:MYXO-CTERM domain-containing protein